MQHLISLKSLSKDDLVELVDRAFHIKQHEAEYAQHLQGKTLYCLFQKTSTRTKLSFQLGMAKLGGDVICQKWEDSNFVLGEIRDEVRYISDNVDIMVGRLKSHQDIAEFAQHSFAPVINGCCDRYHPCQALADVVTIKEKFQRFEGLHCVYVGVRNNVFNSLALSVPRLGMKLTGVTPIVNEPSLDSEIDEIAHATGNFECITEVSDVARVQGIIRGADVVYTDSWVDMEFFNDDKYKDLKEQRVATMSPFQLNAELLQGSKAMVLHDMPVHAGYEISREVVEANIRNILTQAKNRMYAQQAAMLMLLGKN